MLLEFHEISVQKFFSLLTMVMCEKHCFQTNKQKKKKYQMAFVDLVIHKGTTTDSFIIVEEMDSIKKNCRVISRKKKSQYIISSANKTKQTKKLPKKKFRFDILIFVQTSYCRYIISTLFSRDFAFKRKIQKIYKKVSRHIFQRI